MKIQKAELKNKLILKKPVLLRKEVTEAFTIINPKYTASKRYSNSRFHPKKHLCYWENEGGNLLLPRGCVEKLKRLYKKKGIELKLKDSTVRNKNVLWKFKGELKKEKGQDAVKKFKTNQGLLCAPTGSGKTVMFLYLMQRYRQPTLITVHTNLLLKQWIERINYFLGIPEKDIGVIGDGVCKPKEITVGLMQTVVKKPKTLNNFGVLCVDEAHKSPCLTYTKIIENFHGPVCVGLTATPKRRDGLANVMKWYLGGIKVNVSLDKADICKCFYLFLPTDYRSTIPFTQYSKALVALARSNQRNIVIRDTVSQYVHVYEGLHLVLSQNRAHCLKLFHMLPESLKAGAKVLTGKVKEKERIEIVRRAGAKELKILFATDKLIGEGFDEPLITVIYLTCPIADETRLIQYVGRARRQAKGKKFALVVDFFDQHEPILRRSAKKRAKAYKANQINKF